MRIESGAVRSRDSGTVPQMAALQKQMLSVQKQLSDLTKQLANTMDRDAKRMIQQQIVALQQQIDLIQEQMKRLAMPVEKKGASQMPSEKNHGAGSEQIGNRVNTYA